jgi:hypothetical protein
MSDACVGAIVVFAYQNEEDDEMNTVTVHVPETLLWSAAGLAYLFEKTRASFLLEPENQDFEEFAWDSWHIVSIKTFDDEDEDEDEPKSFYLIDDIQRYPPEEVAPEVAGAVEDKP